MMALTAQAATITVTWTDSDDWGNASTSYSKDGITVTASSIKPSAKDLYNYGTFTTTLGNFTKIEVNAFNAISGTGWSGNMDKRTWTGNPSSSVSFTGSIMGGINGLSITFTIEESSPAVTSITLDQTEALMTVGGETLTLTATVLPADATDKSVTWTSSDETVATVDADGVVTAVAPGTATITATANDGSGMQGTCTVTVPTFTVSLKKGTEEAENWEITPNTDLTGGETVTITYSGTKKVKSIKAVKKVPFIPFTVKVTFTDGTNPVDVSSLTISAASGKLVRKYHNTPETYHTGYTVTGGTGGDGDEGHAKLMDGDINTKWCQNGGPWNITFNTAEAVTVDGYTLTTGGDTELYSGRNPKSWTLKGKLNENDNWAVIAQVTDDSTMPAANHTAVNFVADNPGCYQYFYFEITGTYGDGIMQLDDLQLWKGTNEFITAYAPVTITPASDTNELTVKLLNDSEGPDTYTFTAGAGELSYPPFQLSDTTFTNGQSYEITVTLPKLVSSSDITILGGQSDGHETEGYDKLFDGKLSNKWCSFKPGAGTYSHRVDSIQNGIKDQVIWKTESSIVLFAYVLTTGGDTKSFPDRNWKSWTIYGANFDNDSEATIDADSWTQIQKIENDDTLPPHNTANCAFFIPDNNTSYQYYKLVIDVIQSANDNIHQMSEMTLFSK